MDPETEPVRLVDVATHALVIGPDLSITPRERRPGPPERLPGMTVGLVEITADAPHNGERHPDGDEILYVYRGRLELTLESQPGRTITLGPGDACVVSRGEWHNLHMVEPALLLHVTPGPRGDHRPLP